MPYTLPALPYDFAALEPHIDAQTMQIHHDKHHQAYIDKLNAALVGHDDLSTLSVEDRSEERRVGKECRSRWSPYH